MYTQRGKKYIYSVIQANEFIQRGYRCLETGFKINKKGKMQCIHKEGRNIFIQLFRQMSLFREDIDVLKQDSMLKAKSIIGYLIMKKYKRTIRQVKDINNIKGLMKENNVRVKQRIYLCADMQNT